MMENIKKVQLTKTGKGSGYVVIGNCDSMPSAQTQPAPMPSSDTKKIMVMCATDRIGIGDDTLGLKLMVNFLRTLKEMDNELWRLVFVNNGVKLTIEGSDVLEELKDYEKSGLKILVTINNRHVFR